MYTRSYGQLHWTSSSFAEGFGIWPRFICVALCAKIRLFVHFCKIESHFLCLVVILVNMVKKSQKIQNLLPLRLLLLLHLLLHLLLLLILLLLLPLHLLLLLLLLHPGLCDDKPSLCAFLLTLAATFLVLVTLPFSLCCVIKIVKEYERAVIFR